MNNNFFKNLGVGIQTQIEKWYNENKKKLFLSGYRVLYNSEKLNFLVVGDVNLVFVTLLNLLDQLPESIVFDFNKFSSVSYICHIEQKNFDRCINTLNNLDKHLINLNVIYIRIPDGTEYRCVRYGEGDWRIDIVTYNKSYTK